MKKIYFLLIFFSLFTFFAFSKNAFACDGKCSVLALIPGPPTTSSPTYFPPQSTSAPAINNPILPTELSNLRGTTLLQEIITLVINLLFVFGAIIFFIMLLSGGVRWIASGGDKTHLEGAKGQITHALIGLAILLSAFAIIKLIGSLFGIDLLNLSLPTL